MDRITSNKEFNIVETFNTPSSDVYMYTSSNRNDNNSKFLTRKRNLNLHEVDFSTDLQLLFAQLV